MSSITLCASIFTTLAVTVERFLAVTKPMVSSFLLFQPKHLMLLVVFSQEYRNIDIEQNQNGRVAKYLVPVCVLSVLLNIPLFLEKATAYNEQDETVNCLFWLPGNHTMIQCPPGQVDQVPLN